MPRRSRTACSFVWLLIMNPACSNIRAQDPATPAPEAREKIPAADARDSSRPPRIAVFRSPGFPTVDAPVIDDPTLEAALRGLPVDVLATPEAIRERLRVRDFDVLVLTYGSAFPLHAWDAIRSFVERGGGLVVLGGAPFHQPVRRLGAPGATRSGARDWVLGPRQPTFAHELLIGPAERCGSEDDGPRRAFGPRETLTEAQAPGDLSEFPLPSAVFELTVRFATRKDLEDEDGSAGPRDAVLRPLVHVLDARGRACACPLLEIDRLRGDAAGGRWVFAPSDARLPPAWIRLSVERALEGAVEIDVRPSLACYMPGEVPRIRISVRRPFVRASEAPAAEARVIAHAERGPRAFTATVSLSGSPELRVGEAVLDTAGALEPGFYSVDVELPGVPFTPRSASTGFWVRDEPLLASGPRLSVSRDWIRRDGAVFPIIGTTYMASDVHRKFLFEPNPLVWSRDFARMKRHGVNLVRTGLWTGWSRAMLDPGAVDEGMLRALDAYILTAARTGIPVCFTFFAFQPPAFGGSNPFLDPRALEGQKAFVTAIASRYRGVGWIHYDVINEPSYAPRDALWQNRPILDEHERRAFTEWVRARHGDDPLVLRDLWRDASPDVLSLPAPEELSHSMIRDRRRPRKARDFAEFSQDVVARWAATMRETIRHAAGRDVLVTLGQDEGGLGLRPAQQLHAECVDYTAVHTWWNNDDLLWDGVASKVPEKPNLVQETGLMRLEDLDGMPWRTPAEAARLLERKFAYAFASRGAGAIEWAWNVNPYQPLDNEAVIGLVRPDGTAKPEIDVLDCFSEFFAKAAPLLDDFEPDPIVVVLPHSKLFAGRPRAMDGAKRVTRVLSERLGVVPTMLSELRLTTARLDGARLVIAPTPEMLSGSAALALLGASRAGARVLITGTVDGDAYGLVAQAHRDLGVVGGGRPVALYEPTPWGAPRDSRTGFATFDEGRTEQLRRSEKESPATLEGSVWHEPLPLDLAREDEPLCALLGASLEAAGVTSQPSATRVAARVLAAPRVALVICVNETSMDAVRRVVVDGHPLSIPVRAGRARLVLVERTSGRLLASTEGGGPIDSR